MNTTAQPLKIGELAKRSQVSVGTLRYYESLGLTLQQVQFIKKAQSLNFSLADIQNILNLRSTGQSPCSLVDKLLNEKIEHLEQQIQSAIAFKQELEVFRDRVSNIPPTASSDPTICQHISAVSLT